MLSKTCYGALLLTFLVPFLSSVVEVISFADGYVRPVVSDIQYEQIDINNAHVKYSVVGVKNRNCKPVDFSAFAVVDGVYKEVKFHFENDASPNSQRPKGENDFGVWVFEIRKENFLVYPQYASLFVVHDCGSFYNISTEIKFKVRKDNG